jgi:RsiW-degrading membrane proteinase PrsW (M82 family)
VDIVGHVWQTTVLLLPLKEPKKIAQGVLWGLVPDIVAFVPHICDYIFGRYSDITSEELNQYLYWAYPLGHGLPVFFIVFLLVAVARYGLWASLGGEFYLEHRRRDKFRYFHFPMFGWGMHIGLDAISHQKFPTPFLWPLSEFRAPGLFNYSNNNYYTFLNIGLYVACFTAVLIFYLKNKQKKTP